jgi:hypothetical protein
VASARELSRCGSEVEPTSACQPQPSPATASWAYALSIAQR